MAGTFYFLIWRPQQRRVATVRALQTALDVGDEVITTGGIYGTVRSMDDEVVELEIAPGLVIRVARGAIGARITEDEVPIDRDGADGPEETI
jgi:preprotein translocase subunit YajC